ncbi:MAG: S8 family serine peptidase [Chitinophagales bacterium]
MKLKVVVFYVLVHCFCGPLIYSQSLSYPSKKISYDLPQKYWIYFTDKDNSTYSISRPLEYLSEKSIHRREKMKIAVALSDLPVNNIYVDVIKSTGVEICTESKWLNAVSVRINSEEQIAAISQLPFVLKIAPVKKYAIIDDENIPDDNTSFYRMAETTENDYGGAFNQNHMIDVDFLHAMGYTGQGIVIAVLDAGFIGVDYGAGFQSFWDKDQIIETRNFPDGNDSVFFSSTHGANVLSIMGGDVPGDYIGSGPDAKFYLLRTEVGASETVVEEDFWMQGAEYADFVGADIINSSLGYTTFDDSTQDHTYADMDGNTTVVTIAADKAASVGILVCNSAGNEGSGEWHFIGAPADGDSVFTIGAVDAAGNYAPFSSQGPTSDGQIKPNVAGQGAGTAYIELSGLIYNGSGTSYSSPLIAGACASLWSAFPELTNMELMQVVQNTASQSQNPDNFLGYGIPSFSRAYLQLKGIEVPDDNIINILPNPAEDIATILINSKETSAAEINMFNLSGQLIFKTAVDLSFEKYSAVPLTGLDQLARGIYIIQLVGDNYSDSQLMMIK